jgi:hypothetical protein
MVNLFWPDVRFKLVVMTERARAAFVEQMLLLRTDKLPEGKDWLYELKFDRYRALAIKSGDRVSPLPLTLLGLAHAQQKLRGKNPVAPL